MGMTMVEKILAKATGQSAVKAGDVVEPRVDLAMSHENGALVINQFNEIYKGTGLEAKVWDPTKIAIIFDHRVPAESSKTAANQKKIRDFVAKQGIGKFHDIRGDDGGICHQILPENGYVRPGSVVVGTDSHTTSHGALGAFSFGIGATEMAAVWALGKVLNVEVPGTIKVVCEGKFKRHVAPKDLILHLIGKLTAEGANFKVDRVPRRDHRKHVDLRPAGDLQHDGRGRRHLGHRAGRRRDGALPAGRGRGDGRRSTCSAPTPTRSTSR